VAVIFFYADWVKPSLSISPYVLTQSTDTRVALIKVNLDNAPELETSFKIRSMPTFLVVKD
jgi:thioredoxin-like negative regulator of GroEL